MYVTEIQEAPTTVESSTQNEPNAGAHRGSKDGEQWSEFQLFLEKFPDRRVWMRLYFVRWIIRGGRQYIMMSRGKCPASEQCRRRREWPTH